MSRHTTTPTYEFTTVLERPLPAPAENGDTHTAIIVAVTATVRAAADPSGPRFERSLEPGHPAEIARLTVCDEFGHEIALSEAEQAQIEAEALEKHSEGRDE